MYCSKCGTQNEEEARFCTDCGEPMPGSPAPSQPTVVSEATQSGRQSSGSGMRTATLILGLIAATMLFFGGCTAFVTGSIFEGVEEAFGEGVEEGLGRELDDPDDGVTSTSGDVAGAGGFAVFVAILLFVGAGLARVALKTSLVLFVLAMPMAIGLVVVDTTSLFAFFYYLAIVLVGIGVVLMAIAYIKSRSTGTRPG